MEIDFALFVAGDSPLIDQAPGVAVVALESAHIHVRECGVVAIGIHIGFCIQGAA